MRSLEGAAQFFACTSKIHVSSCAGLLAGLLAALLLLAFASVSLSSPPHELELLQLHHKVWNYHPRASKACVRSVQGHTASQSLHIGAEHFFHLVLVVAVAKFSLFTEL